MGDEVNGAVVDDFVGAEGGEEGGGFGGAGGDDVGAEGFGDLPGNLS